LPFVGLVNDLNAGIIFGVGIDDVARIVGGAVVNDEDFVKGVRLPQSGFNALADVSGVVKVVDDAKGAHFGPCATISAD
jgi:hypothetical protein